MRFLRLVVPEVERTELAQWHAESLACQHDWDSCEKGYLDATTFLKPPPDAAKTGINLILLPPLKRHSLGTEHQNTSALKTQQLCHVPTSRKKLIATSTRSEAEMPSFSPLPFCPPWSTIHIRSFIWQILIVCLLGVRQCPEHWRYAVNKSKDPSPIVWQDNKQEK